MAAPMDGLTGGTSEEMSDYTTEIDDEEYQLLKRHLTASGRGRRPILPKLNYICTNKLLLQLHQLKYSCNKSWREVENLITQLFQDISPTRVRTLIDNAAVEIQGLSDFNARCLFYSEEHDLNCAGKLLSNIGIKRSDLLELTPLKEKNIPLVTNAIIVELELFKKRERLAAPIMARWVELLTKKGAGSFENKDMAKAVKCVMSQYTSLIKSKNRSPKKFEDFMAASFIMKDKPKQCPGRPKATTLYECSDIPSPLASNNSQTEQSISDVSLEGQTSQSAGDESPVVQNQDRDFSLKLANLQQQIQRERGKYEEQTRKLEECHIQMEALNERIKEYTEFNQELQEISNKNAETTAALKSQMSKVAHDRDSIAIKMNELQAELRKVKQAPYYRRLCRKESKLKQVERVVMEHQSKGCETKVRSLRRKIKNVQSTLSKTKSWLHKARAENACLRNKIKENTFTMAELEAELDERDSESVETKDGNKFSDNVVKCIIQLVGEAEVPASRCSEVMKIVSKCLFDKDMKLKDLPSERSVLRYADQGHYLAKCHVAESIDKCERFDYHLDGTTKDHRKYIGSQFTTDTGETLSAGFTTVFREDTETLLDQAVDLFKEVGEVYDEKDAGEQYKNILGKLTGVMSDRASVMKSFGRALNTERAKVFALEKNDALHFLHCNAHFLLGLSAMCEDVLKKAEASLGKKIGRDVLPVFSRFKSSSECSSARYIRTACDIFGPRGDEKNGCRDAWEAYCDLKGVKSRITSYRSNRFNNFFEGGAALHHHRSSILDFLANFKGALNLKQQSVLADATCDQVDAYIKAIGIVYCVVTGPYWKLVTSEVKYHQFYTYVCRMHSSFKQWADDPSGLFSETAGMWNEFMLERDSMYDSVFALQDESSAVLNLKEILSQIFQGFVTVTERQLGDFLDGGTFHNIQDESVRAALDHSKLTNLIGEACFGDLGYSVIKRRNATLHHHSTVNMIKRNKTMSTWFNNKSKMEQSELLKISRNKALVLRNKHKEAQQKVQAKAKENLLKNEKLTKEREESRLLKKQDIVRSVKEHGGPCLCTPDVHKMLAKLPKAGDKKTALQSEIRYQKFVMGSSSKLLKLTGTVDELTDRLQVFFAENCQESGATSNTDELLEAKCTQQVEQMDIEVDETESDFVECNLGKEQFGQTSKGDWVAVFYDQDVYIGQVLEIQDNFTAEVTFLERSRLRKGAFCWPKSDDIDVTEAQHVLKQGFSVVSVQCGRSWLVEVPEMELLELLHKKYQEKFCTKA